MQIRALETLVRIDQVQSFSKAAQLQNMTLSALSMQVKALENELGTALFDRSFRPPKLTPLGKRIAAQARQVMGAQRTLTALCGTEGELVGQFRLGFIQSASVRLLPDFLKSVRSSAPKSAFELSSGLSEDLNEQVLLGLADAAVVTRVPTRATGLHFEPISIEEMAFAVPVEHAQTPVEDLPLTLPFIHFRASSGIGNLIADRMETQRNRPSSSIVLDSLEASVECVKAGLGYTLLPLPDILRCTDDRVHVHRAASDALHREIALVVRQENADATWVRIISDLLKQSVARQGASV